MASRWRKAVEVVELMMHCRNLGMLGAANRTLLDSHHLQIAPNLLNQAFVAAAPDCIWLADIA
jgi:hypothetical protein